MANNKRGKKSQQSTAPTTTEPVSMPETAPVEPQPNGNPSTTSEVAPTVGMVPAQYPCYACHKDSKPCLPYQDSRVCIDCKHKNSRCNMNKNVPKFQSYEKLEQYKQKLAIANPTESSEWVPADPNVRPSKKRAREEAVDTDFAELVRASTDLEYARQKLAEVTEKMAPLEFHKKRLSAFVEFLEKEK